MSERTQLEDDHALRLAAFKFLDDYTRLHGDTITWQAMHKGFEFRGHSIVLASQQGIFKPKALSNYPLSLRTTAPKSGRPRPYDDGFGDDGTVTYKYQGTDPAHYQNVWVRNAMRDRIPLIYFHGTVPGRYVAQWPVYVVGDSPSNLEFRVDVDGGMRAAVATDRVSEPDLVRRYGERTTRQRLHQQAFRERVLRAYREHCAVCRLRHAELLDAAHIIPDADLEGEPRVQNGISLCKLHHAAFDQRLFGIRPDLVIEVRREILAEADGPMLKHGLQEIQETKILVPRDALLWPDEGALERRYSEFRQGELLD